MNKGGEMSQAGCVVNGSYQLCLMERNEPIQEEGKNILLPVWVRFAFMSG